MAPPEVLDRLKKLLRLAGSSNQNEADLAMSHAMRIATKFQLDIRAFEDAANAETTERGTFVECEIGIRLSNAQRYVSQLLANYFSVVTVKYHKNKSRIVFVGAAENVDLAILFSKHLTPQFKRAWEDAREGGVQGRRGAFYYGVYLALDTRLKEAREEELRANDVDVPAYLLAVDASVRRVKEWINLPQEQRSGAQMIRQSDADADTTMAGQDAGYEMDIPTKTVRANTQAEAPKTLK